jgi:hypothetical protein
MSGNAFRVAAAAVIGVLLLGGAIYLFGGGGAQEVGAPATIAPTATPPPFPSSGPVAPGTYVIQTADYPAITVTTPAGWQSDFGGLVKNNGTRASMTLMPWIVRNISADPCNWGNNLLDPPVGPSVDDLATALTNQPMRNATTPVDVTVDGFAGKYLELTIPAGLDFTTCSNGSFVSWVGSNVDDTMGFAGPGSHDRIWILDVAGTRLVLDAIDFPEATAQDRAELQSIVDSVQIEPLPERPPSSPTASP